MPNKIFTKDNGDWTFRFSIITDSIKNKSLDIEYNIVGKDGNNAFASQPTVSWHDNKQQCSFSSNTFSTNVMRDIQCYKYKQVTMSSIFGISKVDT